MRILFTTSLIASLSLCAVGALAQQGETLQPDFTFKRVGVPQSGSGNRITVQVAPTQSALPQVGVETPAATVVPQASVLSWFWDEVSPDLDESGPGRLQQALTAMNNAPSGKAVPRPRLQTLHDIASAHGADILMQTVGKDVSPALVLALISIESAGRSDAVSSAGASGLMQLMPATAERFGVTNRADPSENIKAGVAYLSWLMEHFDNDPILALAGYNAGEGAVRQNGGVPPYRETRDYVPKVLAAWTVARGLCNTPPELVSDGCVFNLGG